MRRTLAILVTAGALCCWSAAQAKPANTQNPEEKQEQKNQISKTSADTDANNPNGSVTITSGPNVNAQDTSATITWSTNNRAATIVHYGTDPNNLSEKSRQAGGERDHSVTLSNLQPGTTYYYAIMTDDNTVRQKGQFQTKGSASASTGTSNPGAITITSGPTVTPQSTSATITWTTSGTAANDVKYGTDPNNLSKTWYEAGGAKEHTATLSNLEPGKTYYFAIMERNGNVRTKGQFQTTGATAAAAQPAAGAVSITQQPSLAFLGEKNVTLQWSTNVPANSIVKFGTNMMALNQTAEGTWGTIHQVTLRNLNPNTLYYFQVLSGQTVNIATATKGNIEGFRTLKTGEHAQLNAPCCQIFSH
jgi:phosphodiesterase/alkaline phosphatase D-like protein